jgi:hypothetical protein
MRTTVSLPRHRQPRFKEPLRTATLAGRSHNQRSASLPADLSVSVCSPDIVLAAGCSHGSDLLIAYTWARLNEMRHSLKVCAGSSAKFTSVVSQFLAGRTSHRLEKLVAALLRRQKRDRRT